MINFTPADIKLFSSIFDTVSNVLESGTLKVRRDGIYVSGLDPAHVSMINIEINEGDFEIYDYSEDMDFGVNFKDFVKIIKSGLENERVNICCENTDRMVITFTGGFKKTYSLKLLYITEDDLVISDMDYKMELEIRSELFSNIVNSILITDSNYMKFSIAESKLNIESVGDRSDINIEITKEVRSQTKIKLKKTIGNKVSLISKSPVDHKLYSCEGEFSAAIGINFIKLINKALTLSPNVMCNLSPNTPLRLDFMLNDNGTMIQYYISPKIED